MKKLILSLNEFINFNKNIDPKIQIGYEKISLNSLLKWYENIEDDLYYGNDVSDQILNYTSKHNVNMNEFKFIIQQYLDETGESFLEDLIDLIEEYEEDELLL